MNVLFVYYLPSGGVDTLNRQRCKALKSFGVNGHVLYYQWGAGLQNAAEHPVYVTKDDITIKHIIDSGAYDAVVVTTDHMSFKRFRMLGYTGKLILEIQGYGAKSFAREQLSGAAPIINGFADALLHPNTRHIGELFAELYPHIPQFNFNNCFDSESFGYRIMQPPDHPVIAWLGRIEDNKNWREFLHIGHHLAALYPTLRLWMFEDPNLANAQERVQFEQLIDELGLRDRLTLHANVPHAEMAGVFSKIGDSGGFLCMTSKVEGAPYAALEAMSCRCPVLTTDSDGVSTSVYHNTTGKFYTLGDIGHAVAEARELMDNKPLRESIRTNARHHVATAFSPNRYAEQFLQMLQSI